MPLTKERKDSGKTGIKRNNRSVFRCSVFIGTTVTACLGVAAFYFFTKAPTVTFVDSGEIATSANLGGILHPTGYPLYSILTGMFRVVTGSMIEPVTLTNTLSGFYAVLALFFLVFAARLLGYGYAALVVFPAGLVLSRTFWEQAAITEVYSLSACCFSILLFLYILGEKQAVDTSKLAGFVAGLAAGNHYSALVILPGIFFSGLHRFHHDKRGLAGFIIFFLIGSSVYLYLPLQESNNPLFSWGATNHVKEFFYHISGGQYSIWMFSVSLSEFFSGFARIFRSLVLYDLHVYLPFILVGIPVLLRYHTSSAFLLGSVLFFNFLQVGTYDIPDIEGYLLPTVISLFFIGAAGAGYLISLPKSAKNRKHAFAFIVVYSVSGGAYSYYLNNKYCNHASDQIAHDISLDILQNCEEHSLILIDNWDIYSPILYLQHVKLIRPDVTVIDKELLRRTWYFDYLARYDQKLLTEVVEEKNRFLEQLNLFSKDLHYNPAEIQESFISFLAALLESRKEGEGEAYVFLQSDKEAVRGFSASPWPVVRRLGLGHPSSEYKPSFSFANRISRPFKLLFSRVDYRYLSMQLDYFNSTAIYLSSLNKHYDALRCIDYCFFLLRFLPDTDRSNFLENLVIDKALVIYASGKESQALGILEQAVTQTGSSRASFLLKALSNQRDETE